MLFRLLRRRLPGIQKIVNGSLDDVERVAKFVSDPAGHLANSGKSVGTLLSEAEFGLVGVFDDCEIQIEQNVQRLARCGELRRGALPTGFERAEQSSAKARQCHVREHLVEPDLDMPQSNFPAPGGIVRIVVSGEQSS